MLTLRLSWLLLTIVPLTAAAQQNPRDFYSAALDKWSAAAEESSRSGGSAKNVDADFRNFEAAWAALPEEDKKQLAWRRWNAYRTFATISLREGNVSVAAEYLKKETAFSAQYGLLLTGREPHHFEEFAKLQAQIIAQTGHDPLAGETLPYEFGRTTDGFYAMRQEGTPGERQADFKSVGIPDLKDRETAGYLVRISGDGKQIADRFVLALDMGDGTIGRRIRGMYSAAGFAPSGYGRPERLDPTPILKEIGIDPKELPIAAAASTPFGTQPPSTTESSVENQSIPAKTKSSLGWLVAIGLVGVGVVLAFILWRRRPAV